MEGMYHVSKLGMNNGDYAFIAFELMPLSFRILIQKPSVVALRRILENKFERQREKGVIQGLQVYADPRH